MTKGITCYERDEVLCDDPACMVNGCRLRRAPAQGSRAEFVNGLKSISGLRRLSPEMSDFLHDAAEEMERLYASAPAEGAPTEATHMRSPEYVTGWLFDQKSMMPIWLIEKYKSDALPSDMVGFYAVAIDGKFWRWMHADKFNTMFVPCRRIPAGTSTEDWKDDPSADERWNAGVDFAMKHFCKALGVEPGAFSWDAATETVDGDVMAVIGNMLRAKYGDDWGPDAPSPSQMGDGQ